LLRLTLLTADDSSTLLRTTVTIGEYVALVVGTGIAKGTNESGSTASVTIVFGVDG
jgi:hypothetical protein